MRSLYRFGIAAVLLSACALPSMASPIPANTVSTPDGPSIGLGSTSFATLSFTAPGSFDEFFNFQPSTSGTLTANATEGTSFGNNVINPFEIKLVQVTGSVVLADNNIPASGFGSENVSVGGVGLTGGVDYYVEVIGTITGTIPEGETLNIDGNVTIQPSPLPGALALFGSAMIGFWGYRRRRKSRDVAPLAIA